MRRALLAVAVLLTATASPTFAGYLIIRIILEGGPADSGNTTSPGNPNGPNKVLDGTTVIQPPRPGQPPAPGMPMPSTHAKESLDPSRSIVITVPVEDDFKAKQLDPKATHYTTKDNPYYKHVIVPFYGQKLHASLFVDSTSIQLYEQYIAKPGPRRTLATDMRDKYDLWKRGGKKDPRLLYDAFLLALESGIIRDLILTRDGTAAPDAVSIAQELLDVAESKLPLPTDADRFVKAWAKMSAAVKKPAQQNEETETWKVRVNATAVKLIGHYAIIHWTRETSDVEINRRAMQLNDNFAAFYMLMATRGIVLPVPEKPLLVVLAKQGQDVHRLFPALDGLGRNTDAFYSPDHHILVLSPEPLDEVSQTFLRQNQQYFNKGFNRTALLASQIPKLDHKGEKGVKPEDVARANTLALVEKLMLEESEMAAVSYEGTRQLLFASEALPQHITLPNWLTNGALNTFCRPRGPAFVTVGDEDKPFMTVSFTTGYGVPNYVMQRYFTEMGDRFHKELNPDPVALLENVLKDAYFNGIKDAIDPDPAPPKKVKKVDKTDPKDPGPGVIPPPMGKGPLPPPPPPMPPIGPIGPGGPMPIGPPGFVRPTATITTDTEDPTVTLRRKRARLTIKANATAWALYYFLARAKPSELQAYISELDKAPRDLPIDGATAYEAFIRVFDLAATKGGPADPDRMKKFAKEWLEYIASVPTYSYDVQIVPPERTKKDDPKPKGPPGTFPMPPGTIPGRP